MRELTLQEDIRALQAALLAKDRGFGFGAARCARPSPYANSHGSNARSKRCAVAFRAQDQLLGPTLAGLENLVATQGHVHQPRGYLSLRPTGWSWHFGERHHRHSDFFTRG